MMAAVMFIAVVVAVLFVSGCGVIGRPPQTYPPPNTKLPPNEEPVEIVSVIGPVPPSYPGRPEITITFRNTSNEAIIYLVVSLKITPDFNFVVWNSGKNPKKPGQSTSIHPILYAASIENYVDYPLVASGYSMAWTFSYTKQVQIIPPEK
jgi:hypothetical protein